MTAKEALEIILDFVNLDEYDYETKGIGDAERLLKQALSELEAIKSKAQAQEKELRELKLKWNAYSIEKKSNNCNLAILRSLSYDLDKLCKGSEE